MGNQIPLIDKVFHTFSEWNGRMGKSNWNVFSKEGDP